MKNNTKTYFDALVNSTVELIRFDSSFKPADGEYPFGKETADCLQYFLSLAQSMGFETHNYDNYVGEVVYGKGEDFAVLAHLDVVPAGSGWNYPPFGGVINEDVSAGGVTGKKIWGRGAMDDKGPAMACLYALKALKDEGFMPRRTIKLIVGCNEENGWACIDYYNKVAKMPDEGFTPDADFPVIYAEKGIIHFTAEFPIENAPFTQIKAGSAVNMVCDEAFAVITRKASEALVDYQNPIHGTTLSYDNSPSTLRARGKSAHGSTPHAGANAFQAMLKFFATQNEACQNAYDVLFNDSASLKQLQDETGVLTMSPDVATFENGVLKVAVDVRCPSTFGMASVTERLDKAGVAYHVDRYQPPLYNDKNGELITTLSKVYSQATGSEEEPIAIGGGTYARALRCGVAFGPEMPGDEATIHQPNEYITFDRLQLLLDIYYDAIKAISAPKYTRIGIVKATYNK